MKLNIFCINNKMRHTTASTTATATATCEWQGARGTLRQSMADDRLRSTVAKGEGTRNFVSWSPTSRKLYACYFNFVAIVYHLICIWRSIDRSIRLPTAQADSIISTFFNLFIYFLIFCNCICLPIGR